MLDEYNSRDYYISNIDRLQTLSNKQFNSYIDIIKDIIKNFKRTKVKNIYDNEYSKSLRDIFKHLGFDGIRYINEMEGDINDYTYIAFYQNQIKAIDNKSPTKNNNINK